MLVHTLYRIGRRPAYSGLFLGILSATLLVIALFPNVTLVTQVLGANVTVGTKIATISTLITALPATFSASTLSIAILFALLLAFNITILTYYVRRRVTGVRARINMASLGGFVSGVLGIGCAACGSIVLSALVTTFGGVGLLALLPLHGGEFAILGLCLLLFSSYTLLRHINDPAVCTVED